MKTLGIITDTAATTYLDIKVPSNLLDIAAKYSKFTKLDNYLRVKQGLHACSANLF